MPVFKRHRSMAKRRPTATMAFFLVAPLALELAAARLKLLPRHLKGWIVILSRLLPCQGLGDVFDELLPVSEFLRRLHDPHGIVFAAIRAQEDHAQALLPRELAQDLRVCGLAWVEVENPGFGLSEGRM